MELDLTTADGTLAYIATRTTLDAKSITRLRGGFCNFTWRIVLRTPFRGLSTLVVKHAEPYAACYPTDKIPPIRLMFDSRALNWVRQSQLCSDETTVSTPAVVHYDPESQVLIMQDVGSLPTLREYMSMRPAPSTAMAASIGRAMGEFIAKLHRMGRKNDSARALLSSNMVGRMAGKVAFYDRLVAYAAEYGVRDPLLKDVANFFGPDMLTNDDTLIMGDFWPGNILIDADPPNPRGGLGELRKLWVVDWEFSRYGPPSVDVGTFAAECWWLSRFRDRAAGEAMRRHFLEEYARLAKLDTARVIIQMGVHWIVWSKHNEWGGQEEIRECVAKGAEYIMQGWRGNKSWAEESLARELVRGLE